MQDNDYTLSRFAVVEPIEEDIKYPIEKVLTHLSEWGGMPIQNKNEIIVTLILTHIDSLGYFYSADRDRSHSSTNAIKFMRIYFGRIDNRYNEVSGLLYTILRHGLVHRSIPRILRLPTNQILGIKWTDSLVREKYLRVVSANGEYRIKISPKLLIEDMLLAIDYYCKDYTRDKNIKQKYKLALHYLAEPQNIVRCNINNISDSDVQYILSNISDAKSGK